MVKKAILVLALVLLFALPAAAQSPIPTPTAPPADGDSTAPPLEDAQDITGVLSWLAAGGAAPAISLILNKQKWFKGLPADSKVWIVMGFVVFIPIVAKAMLAVIPSEAWSTLQPWWATAVGAFEIGWPLSQVTHLLIGKNMETE